jgi:hypothetical protein
MNRYYVSWHIDIEAKTPRAAAERALKIQRDPDSWSSVFEVRQDGDEATVEVDLNDDVL